jgi:hypothetical protein
VIRNGVGVAVAIATAAITIGFIVGVVLMYLAEAKTNDAQQLAVIGAIAAIVGPTIVSLIAILKAYTNEKRLDNAFPRLEDVERKTETDKRVSDRSVSRLDTIEQADRDRLR